MRLALAGAALVTVLAACGVTVSEIDVDASDEHHDHASGDAHPTTRRRLSRFVT